MKKIGYVKFLNEIRKTIKILLKVGIIDEIFSAKVPLINSSMKRLELNVTFPLISLMGFQTQDSLEFNVDLIKEFRLWLNISDISSNNLVFFEETKAA